MRKAVLLSVFIIFINLYAFPGMPGNSILALYKSSDGQTEEENEICLYLSGMLSGMGFEIVYQDVDSGLPGDLEEYRAIISWFRSPSLKYPENYIEFINNAIDSGIKFIAFDNFGAYQNRRTEEYLDPAVINTTMKRLGLVYMGDRTDDNEMLEVSFRDNSIVKENISEPDNYFRYVPVDRNINIFLSIKRTDMDYQPSPVVTSNRNGGIALSGYVYRKSGSSVSMILDLKLFVKNILFPGPLCENIVLLTDPEDEVLAQITQYTKEVLARAKIPFEIIERQDFPKLLPGDLNRFTAAGIILKEDSELDPVVLSDYLENGGSIVNLFGGAFSNLKRVLALDYKTDQSGINRGYQFSYGFLFGEGVFLEDSRLEWTSGTNLPSDEAVMMAFDYIRYTPLLWVENRDRGKILYWNWDGFYTGECTGLILESFLYVRPVGAAATPGLGIMFIDGWPLPLFNTVKDPLTVTDMEFYTEVWWPDIKEIFSDYDISFSSYLIFNQNDIVESPFSGNDFYIDSVPLQIADEIIERGYELAFHGFNDMSLTVEKTEANINSWPSLKNMEASLNEARISWINLFGAYSLPFSYTAPGNIISDDGIEALHNIFPEIKVISAFRSGTGEESCFGFGPHPVYKDVYFIPRNTRGYHFTDKIQRLIVSSVSGEGIWSHFIHADDIFIPERSEGDSWSDLKSGFTEILDFVYKHFPWLTFVNTRDAYSILNEFDNMNAEYIWNDNTLEINSTPGLMIRIRQNNKNIIEIHGAEIVYQYEHISSAIVRTSETHAYIKFGQLIEE